MAGLQAIGTARRLGAVVKAYDVRPETREQAESLGAQFVTLKTQIDATGAGGYARELTAEERAAQQAELNEVIGGMDVVITTAQVPGRKPPVLVTAEAVGKMKPGSVIVDMAASALGGNCELSKAGETVVTDNLVTILAPENLPASMPIGSSAVLRPEHLRAAPRAGQGRQAQPRPGGRDRRAGHDHPRRRDSQRGRQEAARAGGGEGMSGAELGEFLTNFTIFTLAILCGFAVISKVPATLHTPLMSGANSIHGIVLVGSMFIAMTATDLLSQAPVADRRGVRDDERRRRLRRHRPDAPDVQAQARAAPKADQAEG